MGRKCKLNSTLFVSNLRFHTHCNVRQTLCSMGHTPTLPCFHIYILFCYVTSETRLESCYLNTSFKCWLVKHRWLYGNSFTLSKIIICYRYNLHGSLG
ncbi:hypothetical protein XELAEV_18022572mg [Xenopus laevis]|uniref:Uncharacterized protein n=1 Tax=Xenopus laevis TaxID=8355 RepID=A0A974D2M9_XENLA|nr:hypothetical protein XELAEV_18022572mg [Xenopus laevis]